MRTPDMGLDRQGHKKNSYAPGIEIHATITILAEGCRGNCTKQLIKHFELYKDCDSQTYGIGLKQLWKVLEDRAQPGLIQHTIGWPLSNDTYGGSFIYHLDDDRIAIGFAVGLDYADPRFSPFEAFQQFKHHPKIKPLLKSGDIVSSGSRALVEGGWQSLPKWKCPARSSSGTPAAAR